MANYYSQTVVNPAIPGEFINENETRILTECGFELEGGTDAKGNEDFFAFAPEGVSTMPDLSEIPLTSEERDDYVGEDMWVRVLQNVIRRSAEAKAPVGYFTVETAFTCGKMRPDGFGGGAMFITENGVAEMSTGMWLAEKIRAFEDGTAKIPCPKCGIENCRAETRCHECGAELHKTEPKKGKSRK